MKTIAMYSRIVGLLSGLLPLLWVYGCTKEGAKVVVPASEKTLATATFAGGCFWCMEPPFDALPGVVSTVSGYTGGWKRDPSYEDVSAGATGHAEAVQVLYDPAKIGYRELLKAFWRTIDPTVKDRQFCDIGRQYRTAIFYESDEQRILAEASMAELEKNKPFPEPIATEIVAAGDFYPAEAYHQDYYRKNPIRYKFYRYICGRDRRLKQLWGLPAAWTAKASPAH